VTYKSLPTVTPGEVLQEEFLKPLKVTQYRLAKDISVPPRRINEIVKGMRAVTADTAIRLARYFGMSERFWLNLQAQHDIETTKRKLGKGLEDQVQPRPVYYGPDVTFRGDKIYVQMEDGKRVRVTPRTKREYGKALMERMNQYFVAQGTSRSEVRQKALIESLRGRPLGLYVVVKEGGKPVRVTLRAIRKYGRALVEPLIRGVEAQGITFPEFLEKIAASKRPKTRRADG
jgi:addiction module HigA family antidote